jgi:hypothetical protein
MSEPSEVHTASFEFVAGPIRTSASAKISTKGMLATGAMVAMIILAVAPVVWAATSPARRRAQQGRDAGRIAQKRDAD